MRILFYSLCGLLIILLSATGCSKTSQLSKTALLTLKPWKMVADSINPGRTINGQLVTDLYPTSYYDSCERDDYITFFANGTYEQHNGALKCYSTDPQSIRGTWYLENDDTRLVMAIPPRYL